MAEWPTALSALATAFAERGFPWLEDHNAPGAAGVGLEPRHTAYHQAGTCRMGPDGDAGAVVDQRLRVRGVAGLHVADASVMPRIPTAFTNLRCYMIGERLAEWLPDEP